MEKRQPKKRVSKKIGKSVAAPYYFGIGRRKTALVSVKLFRDGSGRFMVNQRELPIYFPTPELQKHATLPLHILGLQKKVDVEARARGGGISAQAQALGMALSRALVLADVGSRTVLKKEGLLRRDAREKERKKPGLKRARRAPQWQKR